jgi:hypothetical protein
MCRLLRRHDGPPRPAPGVYLRLLLIGYFEGIDSERGVAWRAVDSLALRDLLGLDLDVPPDHSTISRTRRLIVVETHRAAFTWVAQCLGHAGLIKRQDDRGRRSLKRRHNSKRWPRSPMTPSSRSRSRPGPARGPVRAAPGAQLIPVVTTRDSGDSHANGPARASPSARAGV